MPPPQTDQPGGHGSFSADAARERIDGAARLVRNRRRWEVGTLVAFGAITIGYFALLGGMTKGAATDVATVIPILAVLGVVELRNRRPPRRTRVLQQQERWLGILYFVLVLVAGVATDFAPHPLPALLTGIPAGLVCWLGAVFVDQA